MIEGLRPYGEYKALKLPWLDAIPAHWEMIPNRALMKDQREVVGERAADYTLLSLTLRGVIARDMVNPKGKFPSQFNTYKVVRPNDMIFCLFDIDETPRGVGLSRQSGMITGAYDVFTPTSRVDPRFINHYYRFVDDGKLMKPLYTGLRKTIQRGTFAGLKTPVPPPDEQLAIVRFLDHANGKIDRFIRAKRKLIGLLNEQKQAIIHRAVTRGLNPNAPLKPSGVPWLGEIPRHWEVRKIKSFVSTYGGMTPSKGEAEYWNGTIPWVSPKDMKVRAILDSQDHISASALRRTGIALIQPPAVLIVVRGMILARTFPTAVTGVPVTINQDMKALVPRPGLSAEYFVSLLTGIQRDLLLLIEIAGHGTCCLRTDAWGNFMIPLPPVSEQYEIEQHLKQRLSIQNTAIARTEREIALMQEYRSRLTADVVTGKLDVREAAARLPEPQGEPLSSDEIDPSSDLLEDSEPDSSEEG
jgi:type I restriction enzyme S subunit